MITFAAPLSHPGEPPRLKILDLLPSAKSLFPGKMAFTGSEDKDLDVFGKRLQQRATVRQ